MAEKRLLILRLEGLLQSWGSGSKWDERDTEDFPTKSGIVGLLGCALGFERGNPELIALSDAIVLAVRADRRGKKAEDYQTVTGAPLRTAEGKRRSLGNTIVSRRHYLQDACFTVFLKTDEFWHQRIVDALREPKWCLYLGRKSCVPSRPILECEDPEYENLSDALARYPLAYRAEFPVPFETEEEDEQLSSITRPDQMAGTDRGFIRRRIWKGIIREGNDVSYKD